MFDGRLDEGVYQTVPPVNGFLQTVPDSGQPASQPTDVWVMFDADTIYVAARCWDSAGERGWVAQEMRRDRFREGDNFGVAFDTYYDRRNGFAFYTNQLGAWGDFKIGNEGRNNNVEWDPVWDTRSKPFEGGWTVEMQIPFKSLRYQPGTDQVWGVQFRRTVRRTNENSFLTRLPVSAGTSGIQRFALAATLVGLEVPSGSRNLEVKPYLISRVETDRTSIPTLSNDLANRVGLDVKYGITQNLTTDITFNTDFAQVEVDDQQVNLTRFNLFFPEKREFFLEGRELFSFGQNDAPQIIFTRRIGLQNGREVPIIAGARITGKVEGTSLAALNVQTDAEPTLGVDRTNFTVLRVKQDVLRKSSIGAVLTGRSESQVSPGRASQTYGIDGFFSFFDELEMSAYYARADTPGLAGDTNSYQTTLRFEPDTYGFNIDYLHVGDDYNPEVGFVQRLDMKRTFVSARISPRPKAHSYVRRFDRDREPGVHPQYGGAARHAHLHAALRYGVSQFRSDHRERDARLRVLVPSVSDRPRGDDPGRRIRFRHVPCRVCCGSAEAVYCRCGV